MSENVSAEFLLSSFEYRAIFAEPIFSSFERPTTIAETLYSAFREWNVGYDDISFRSIPATASDLQVTCELFNKRLIFAVYVGQCTVTVTNPNWSEAELIQSVIQKGLGAVEAITGSITKTQSAILALHVKGPGKSRQERLEKFRPIITGGPAVMKATGYGFCVYGEDISWLVDLSAVYPDAFFVRMIRVFEPSISAEEMATSLYKDEHDILNLLELNII